MRNITIILPVKNGADFVAQSIQSVLNQTYKDFNFLISDDASTDDTYAIISSFNDARISLFKQSKSLGQFGSFNYLLRQCKTSLIHFWSHDDVMAPDCIEKIINFHQENTEIALSYCGSNSIDEKGNIIIPWSFDATPKILDRTLYAKFSLAYGCLAGSISQVTIDYSKIEQKIAFNDNFHVSGDFEFWTNVAENYKIGFINGQMMSIRNHKNQVTKNIKNNYYAITEGLPIINRLAGWTNIKESDIKTIKRELIFVYYFNQILFLFIKGKFKMAFECLKLLSHQDNIIIIAYSWLKMRFFYRGKYENKKMINKLLLTTNGAV